MKQYIIKGASPVTDDHYVLSKNTTIELLKDGGRWMHYLMGMNDYAWLKFDQLDKAVDWYQILSEADCYLINLSIEAIES